MSGSKTVPNVVNFSELSAQEQSKYVDFLLSNNFIFNNDANGKEESFLATIKINTKKGGGGGTEINQAQRETSQTSHDKENAITMNNSLGTNEIKGNRKDKHQDRMLTNKNTKQMKVTKSPIRKNTVNIKPLQNITNSKINKEQHEWSNNQLSKDIGSKDINDKKITAFSYEEKQEENTISAVEVRKQQILEKLQLKLQEANQLAECEEEKEGNQLKQQGKEGSKFQQDTLKVTQKHEQLKQNNKRQEEVVNNQKRTSSRSKSNQRNNSNSTRSTSNNRKVTKQDDKTQDKSTNQNIKRRKNSHSKDEKRKPCKISQELMQKNMKYITNLQDKKKEQSSTSQDHKKSVSPQITPRLSQTSQTQRSSSSTPNSRNNIQHKKEQIQKQIIHKPPSTFEQIMQKQSHLINSVCAQIPRRINNNDNKISHNNTNNSYLQQGEQCFEFNSFGSPTGNCNIIDTNINPNDNTTFHSKDNHTRLQYDDNGDGDIEFKLYNIKNKRNNSKKGIQGQNVVNFMMNKNDQSHSHNSNHCKTVVQERSQTNNQVEMKRIKQLQDINDGQQVHLTELRQFTDQIKGIKPQKMSISQILHIIDELYQAKFYKNTLIMKMNSKNVHNNVQIGQDSHQFTISEDNSLNNQQYTHQSNQNVIPDRLEIQFSEFINEYFHQKYTDSHNQRQQYLLNLIVNIEYFLAHSSNYPRNHILALRTFTAFVEDLRTKEEFIFYLFVRQMLLKCIVLEDDLEMRISNTMNIELSLEQCQQILEQVYGKKEQKIIDRFMQRLGESVLQDSNNEMNIDAHFFLDLALEDYIEGKTNKIYESSEYQQQQQYQQSAYQQGNTCESQRDKVIIQGRDHQENERYDTQEILYTQEDEEIDNYNQMSSFEKLEYTFEQSFGDADHHNHQSRTQYQSEQQPQQLQKQLQLQMLPSKYKYDCFKPSNQLEQRIWDKMVQKIHEFLELVISDNYDSTNQSHLKFEAVERIVTQKINKILQCLMYGCREQWLELLCIITPSVSQDAHLNGLLNQLQVLRSKQSVDITNSQLSTFCKTVLQTKELSKAIGKLLLCVLMPDSQVNSGNSYL